MFIRGCKKGQFYGSLDEFELHTEDIALFALADSHLPRQLFPGSSLAIGC